MLCLSPCWPLQAKFRRCDQRNLNYSPLCSLEPNFSPVHWQKPIKEIYQAVYQHLEDLPGYIRQEDLTGTVLRNKQFYLSEMENVEREFYPSDISRDREMMESYTTPLYSQTYDAYESDIAVVYVYFGQPTTTQYVRDVSLSWVGFLAQAGGLIGACLGFSFISLVEVVYWFIIR